MPGYIYSDDRNRVDSPVSKIPRPISSGTSPRVALADISNSRRLNKNKHLKPLGQSFDKKGRKSYKALTGLILDPPKLSTKRYDYKIDSSPGYYSQVYPDFDDAATEGSYLAIDSALDPETLQNTLANSPYLDRPTKKVTKETNNAVLGRASQPIDQPLRCLRPEPALHLPTISRLIGQRFEDLNSRVAQRLRAINKSSRFVVGNVRDTRAGAERDSFFEGRLKYLPGFYFSREEKNRTIEHWLDTSSSLWNAELRLSTCGIANPGEELSLDELEAAAGFDKLNLPRPLDRLISAVENVGNCPDSDIITKEIVVAILRTPETASKLEEFGLSIPLERFNAAINHVQKQPGETEVAKAYGLARAAIKDRAFSVTPTSFGGDSGYILESSETGISAEADKPAITDLDKPPIRRVALATAVEVKRDPYLLKNQVLKAKKVVRFDETPTIISTSESCTDKACTSRRFTRSVKEPPCCSTEIIKEAKALAHAATNIVPGIEHIQKKLFGMKVRTRMQMLDEQFSSQIDTSPKRRKTMLRPAQDAPYGLDGAMDDLLDGPFHVSHDGFISAPLPPLSMKASTAAPPFERRDVHDRPSRFMWNRDWELARERHQLQKVLTSLEREYGVLADAGEVF
ncbi:hypothetical protein FKW77_009779 [Venturia effusa]|uniref:Uncharacterized protein n=1 Tax=Venturia effusa TaxID=50376 RepID=A0A517LEP8_9PEZI|nr:hypothetical protein FKW77_009779 [Venturia effusa]